jgi:hypothetical protein
VALRDALVRMTGGSGAIETRPPRASFLVFVSRTV